MKQLHRLYYLGMALAIALIIVGELVWLPDPIRFGRGLYWIDALDFLVYVLALVPLIWIVTSAVMLFRKGKAPRIDFSFWSKIRAGAVFIVGLIAMIIILTIPKQLPFSVSALALSWLLVFIDLFFSECKVRKVPYRSISAFVLTVGVLLGLFCPTGYLVTYPGITLNMNRYAQIQGGSQHGDISGVLVFDRPAFPVDWVYAKLFPHYSIEVNRMGISIGEYNQEVHTEKVDANAAGSAIALQKLGRGKGITSTGILVTGIVKNSPAEGILQRGDVIASVSGQTVTNVRELSARMGTAKPGDQVDIGLLREGKPISLKMGTRASTDDPNRAALGIYISNQLQYDIPETVNYHNYLLHEGGPSHGAMLALTLIDQLTPSGILNGHQVAGTGTIEPDGSVGPVGGLEQKAYTVSRTEADVFFVPAQNEDEARKGAPDLQIVPVQTLDDMLIWLREHPKQTS
ncbi:PDZ domain-containing protein [Paenibacillus sp. SI8]|uniref:PDZ domain-containing protein n=1 Tax=unclassified Paenibacillus TaxID=185978 RepID=UPI0034668E10